MARSAVVNHKGGTDGRRGGCMILKRGGAKTPSVVHMSVSNVLFCLWNLGSQEGEALILI